MMQTGGIKTNARMLRMRSGARGFTIVEMMIAAFIAMIIFSAGFVVINGTIRARNEAAARIRATEHARLFFQMLERDLAGAYPAFANVTKESLLESGYDIAVGQNVSTGTAITIESDAIQFYTRIDGRGLRDEYAFVRYYINNRQQLCREVIPSADPTTEPAIEPIADVLDLQEFAMFDRVRSLYVSFHEWVEKDKDYFPQLSSRATLTGAEVARATHIRVQLFSFDTTGTIQVDDGGGVKIVDQDVERTEVDFANRVMQKVLPIPGSFTQ